MKYLVSKEIAKLWNVSERSVRNYCASGRVLGSILKGKTWLIPSDAKKPVRQIRRSFKMKRLLDHLREEKDSQLSGRIYHKLQIEYAYNSNHIEGSALSYEQTRFIYETKQLGISSKSTKVDDVIETVNHFRCFDYVIENADKKLNENLIKQLHLILKSGTTDSLKPWFKVGDYKLLNNEVGNKETSSPENVRKDVKKLLDEYNSLEKVTVEDIVDFHYKFESIHPFQDGNGRVGRLIILKECLKYNIVPILILDDFKEFYYRGLSEYENEKGYLIDTCLHGQDVVQSYLNSLKIKTK